jgi:hypothetical protein
MRINPSISHASNGKKTTIMQKINTTPGLAMIHQIDSKFKPDLQTRTQ